MEGLPDYLSKVEGTIVEWTNRFSNQFYELGYGYHYWYNEVVCKACIAYDKYESKRAERIAEGKPIGKFNTYLFRTLRNHFFTTDDDFKGFKRSGIMYAKDPLDLGRMEQEISTMTYDLEDKQEVGDPYLEDKLREADEAVYVRKLTEGMDRYCLSIINKILNNKSLESIKRRYNRKDMFEAKLAIVIKRMEDIKNENTEKTN